MPPREDLIASAVTFLQDPSVAASPIEKRRQFLESKNLTNEEIDLAFARVGTAPPSSPSQQGYYPPPQYSQGPPPYGYGGYPYPGGPWAQQAMEPPKRDWRDWFIMATVTTGVSWGLYQLGKRYVMPLIKPPTPEQLEQDKSDISAQFDRAFTLIEQLAVDTEALKTAETERNTKLDGTLKDVETVVTDLRTANERREQENRRLADDVNRLRDSIPKALEGWKNERDLRLQELSQEMKSLKTLMSNRLQPTVSAPQVPSPVSSPAPIAAPSAIPRANGVGSLQVTVTPAPANSETVSGTASPVVTENGTLASTSPSAPPSKRPNKAAIPAWQMAAAARGTADEAGSQS